MAELVNGKYYPMWQSLVEKKNKFIGGKVFQYDMGMKECSTITNLMLEPNGKDSAKVVIHTQEDEDPWFFDVQFAGIGANDTDEEGLAIHTTFMGTWVLQEKPA